MQRSPQIVLMAAIAALLSSHQSVFAETPITPSTDDSGHKIYVNDVTPPAAPQQKFRSQQKRLAYWSTTEHRWKSVPHANVQAAKSAAAEVDQYLGNSRAGQNSLAASGFSQLEINA